MKRLFIDLEVCSTCQECLVACADFSHPHSDGVVSLLEYATFAVVCHRCEEAPCVQSCYKNALEKQSDDIVKRYNMRCVSCKSCTIACPFGVILPEMVPYLSNRCAFCLGVGQTCEPVCSKTCPHNAIGYREVEESPEENIYVVADHLAVKWPYRWFKQEPVKKLKR